MSEEELFDAFDTIGKAVGFALGETLLHGESMRTGAGLSAFATTLYELIESERFTEEVGLVIEGIAAGINARARAALYPDSPTLL